MKNTNKKNRSLLVCFLLVMSMAMSLFGCSAAKDTENPQNTEDTQKVERTVLGEGNTLFYFTVVDKDGNETHFEIHTDKENVGAALLEHKLIEGEEGQYGLYVKTVNGITADYDKDGTYWAFYVNDAYASLGVDATKIENNATYAFKVEK